MSAKRRKTISLKIRGNAVLFAALGDVTRLTLLIALCQGSVWSIARLTGETALTRQAVTKHLRVLERAGLVRCVRRGRERVFRIEPEPIEEARRALESISKQWDRSLARLKSFVEDRAL